MIKHAANEMVMIAITFINVAAYIIVIATAICVGAVALHDDSFSLLTICGVMVAIKMAPQGVRSTAAW